MRPSGGSGGRCSGGWLLESSMGIGKTLVHL